MMLIMAGYELVSQVKDEDGMRLIMAGYELVSQVKAGSLDRVSYLIRKGTAPDARDGEGNTALFWACCRGHAAICRILIINGADVNSGVTATGATPLMACADNDQVACMEGLLRHGSVEVNQCNTRGDTALHMGAYRGYTRVLRLLFQHLVNPFIRNKSKRTALEEAQAQEESQCEELLRGYMDSFPGRRVLGSSRRNANETMMTPSKEMQMPINGLRDPKDDIGTPHSTASFQSTDSAVVVSPSTSLEWCLPNLPTSFSSSCNVSDHSSNLSKHSLGYGDLHSLSSPPNSNVKGQCFPDRIERSRDFPPRTHSFDPLSADSLYRSLSLSPNMSLDSGTASTSETTRGEFSASFSKSRSKCSEGKSRRFASENSEEYPSRINDLSSKMSFDSLPSFDQSLNIVPDRTYQTRSPVNSKLNRSSGTSKSSYGQIEVIDGVQMSDFIENLQMQLLQNEMNLRQEQRHSSDLQQQIKNLWEENSKLKDTIRSLYKTFSQRSSAS